jgi:hypothetical protein
MLIDHWLTLGHSKHFILTFSPRGRGIWMEISSAMHMVSGYTQQNQNRKNMEREKFHKYNIKGFYN